MVNCRAICFKESDAFQLLEIDPQLPLKELDKAALIFYIKINNRFHKKLPIYNIVVRSRTISKVTYEYVYHLTLRQLYWFILRGEGYLSRGKIVKISRWMRRITRSKALIRREYTK